MFFIDFRRALRGAHDFRCAPRDDHDYTRATRGPGVPNFTRTSRGSDVPAQLMSPSAYARATGTTSTLAVATDEGRTSGTSGQP
jgi:hypothetical protein